MQNNILIFSAFLLIFCSPVHAQDSSEAPAETTITDEAIEQESLVEALEDEELKAITQSPALRYGLAMHGEPKYDRNARALDYVNSNAPKGGTMKSAAIGTFDSLNPYAIKGRPATGLDLVYDRLMGRVWDEPFTIYPLIAESVEVPEDRSEITFNLNPAARFNDGSMITAADVLFSFETLKNEGRPNMRRVYQLVTEVTTTDSHTIHFKLGPGHDEETVMILALMPVLSKAYWETRKFDAATVDIPVTNGPYKIDSFEPGRRIVFKRDENYWAKDLFISVGHYNFDEIIYDYYRDDTVAFEAFKAGDLNFRREMDAGQWASAYDFPAVKDGRVKLDTLEHGRTERTRALIFNTRRAPFDDIRVRQALSLMLDFEWANTNMYYDQYKRISSYFPNSDLSAPVTPSFEELELLNPYKDELASEIFGNLPAPAINTPKTRRENMRKADQLLKEAGWVVKDGRRMKNGQLFKFEIILDAPEEEKLALHFKRSLEKIGIFTNIRVLDAAAFRGRLNEYDYDMTLYHWQSTLSPGTEQILYWSCDAGKQPARWNFAGICSKAIDDIAASVARSKTREELKVKMNALDRLLIHGYYAIPLYYSGEDHVAYWKPMKHPEQTPLYGTVIETWWMDQP